jgi:hypothetical protein
MCSYLSSESKESVRWARVASQNYYTLIRFWRGIWRLFLEAPFKMELFWSDFRISRENSAKIGCKKQIGFCAHACAHACARRVFEQRNFYLTGSRPKRLLTAILRAGGRPCQERQCRPRNTRNVILQNNCELCVCSVPKFGAKTLKNKTLSFQSMQI